MIEIGDNAVSYEDFVKDGTGKQKWRVAIPSYKRAHTLVEKTLNLLKQSNVPASLIDIFVANDAEQTIYESILPRELYAEIIIGVEGMMNIRNFIQSYYEEGQQIVCLDDDLRDVYKIDKRGEKRPIENLSRLFDYAFTLCQEIGSDYWGIYAASNTFFMGRTISLGLRYIIGSFWGMRVTHDQFTYVTMDDKEDFERSVRAYLKCGNVVRLDFISANSNYYGEKGGMQETRTEERVKMSGIKLIKMFPMQVVWNSARKRHFEVRLQEKRADYKKKSRRKLKML